MTRRALALALAAVLALTGGAAVGRAIDRNLPPAQETHAP